MSTLNHQKKICKKFGLSYQPCDMEKYLYITPDFNEKNFPIEGKRYLEDENFCGWYIWSGENPKNNDVFKKVPLSEIDNYSKDLNKFLWLEQGTRFIIEQDYFDAEYDYRVFNMIDNNY